MLLSSHRGLLTCKQRTVYLHSDLILPPARHSREVPLLRRHGHTVITRAQDLEYNITATDDQDRADEIRVQMAKAMNATVVRFRVPEYRTTPGNWLSVVGSVDELGAWNAAKGARMKWLDGHEWVADVILPQHYSGCFEYKLVLMNEKGMCVWEPGTNRKVQVAGNFSIEQPHIELSLQWGLREEEIICDSAAEFPSHVLEAMYERAEKAVKAMPGINAATVLLQAQQQLSESKRLHKQQVTSMRAQLVTLQQSSQRETNRVQSRMRELERAMETIQARLEQERAISEKHIELLQQQISEMNTKAAAARAGEERNGSYSAAASLMSSSASEGIAAYEPHVMSLLPNYSGLSLERLHNMLGQAVFTPKYQNQDPVELASLLEELVKAGKITMDNGIYRYRSRGKTIAATRRTATPRTARHVPETPTPPRQLERNKPSALTPQIMSLEPMVLSTLDEASAMSGGAGVSLERLVGLLQMAAPEPACGYEEVSVLMKYLQSQAKVIEEKGLYRHARAQAGTRTMPHHSRPVTPTARRGGATPVPQRTAAPKRAVAQPPPHKPRGRTFSDGEEEYSAPSGSVAGGPPGSQRHQHATAAAVASLGGSLMPAFDSTGAHPTLASVSAYERPILSVLARQGPQSLERLRDIIASEFLEHHHCTLHDIAPVVKNLVDQHKVAELNNNTVAFLQY